MDAPGVLSRTKKWSVPENFDNKADNPWMKKERVQNETWIKDWVEDWLTDAVHQNYPNLDESDYDRAFVNESLPELLETKQQLFWNP